jgi:hypothetical protein
MIDRDRDDTLKFNRLCFTGEHTLTIIFCHFIQLFIISFLVEIDIRINSPYFQA